MDYIAKSIIAGPSAHLDDQWVGYEDQESVYAKGKYIMGNGYGGATIWTVDLDDFQNRCCLESYPLLKTINRALGSYQYILVNLTIHDINNH